MTMTRRSPSRAQMSTPSQSQHSQQSMDHAQIRQLDLDQFSSLGFGSTRYDSARIPRKPEMQSRTTIGQGVYRPSEFNFNPRPQVSFFQGSSMFCHSLKPPQATPIKDKDKER